jgi:GGDEF domain-containing protein
MPGPVHLTIVSAVLVLLAGAAIGAALVLAWTRRSQRAQAATTNGVLPDRAAAMAHLVHTLSLAERQGAPVSVLALALDNPPRQQRALRRLEAAIESRLLARLRAHESLARWDTVQWLAILPATDVPAALVLASDLRQLVLDTPVPAAHATCSISIGLHSRTPQPRQDLHALAAEMVIAAQRVLALTAANGPGRIEIEP